MNIQKLTCFYKSFCQKHFLKGMVQIAICGGMAFVINEISRSLKTKTPQVTSNFVEKCKYLNNNIYVFFTSNYYSEVFEVLTHPLLMNRSNKAVTNQQLVNRCVVIVDKNLDLHYPVQQENHTSVWNSYCYQIEFVCGPHIT